ncbi:MAG: hypothetical protein EU532_13600, partial [Promethearchaeota archaeon]
MTEKNNLKWEDVELLKELGSLTRFKRPVPSKEEVETSNLNKNMYYEADNGQIISITIIMSGLAELPEYIGNFSSLKTLNLKNNELKVLPDSIGNLSSLEDLDLSSNRLDQLPNTIGDLKSLKILLLNNNRGIKIPDSIENLTSLVKLDL